MSSGLSNEVYLSEENKSDYDCDEEIPSDDWFYGKLYFPVKNIESLIEIMSKGLKKFIDTQNLGDCPPEDLGSTIDLWFDHDSLRNDYFDHLVDEKDFDQFCVTVIFNATGVNIDTK
jgi:hypothetical protein